MRETLTKKEAEDLPGCEAYFDSAKHEFVIRPKNGANEGVISYSLANKKNDFYAINSVLAFKTNIADYAPVRFDKRVYIYDSTDPGRDDDGLFFQAAVKTINITDNLNIKFAKNLAKFFQQKYDKSAHYIKGVENWDTSNVENMRGMFHTATQLEGKLDLSHWNVSKVDTFQIMFQGVGNENDSFVLDFSNKKFKNSANIRSMFTAFRGVLVANNWTLVDPNGENPIQKLLNCPICILAHRNKVTNKLTGLSGHLLITNNPTILEKNKTEKYKFYRKVKVIYKTKEKEQSVELELPAVYDSRIDENGKPDTTKAASSDPMKVVKPQIDEAIKNAVKEMRTKNPDLNLPENVIPVPVHEVKDTDSPTALFQTYYLATVKEEVTKAKTTYTADPNLKYQEVEYDSQPEDGKKQVITGAMKDGAWNPDATSEKEITKAVDGKALVGNKKVETEELNPATVYEADSSLTYKQQQPTEGTRGTKTTTTIYKVNPDTGLTDEVEGTPTVNTVKAKDKVIKVGNKEVIQNNDGSTTTKTYKVNPNDGTLSDPKVETARPWTNIAGGASVSEVLKGKMTYVADESLPYGQTQKESDPKDGEKITTPTGKVENGKWVEGEPKVEITAAVNGVTKVGNKKVETEELNPATVYEADSSLTYKQQQPTEGTRGTKTTTTIYKVNPDTGLTDEVEGTPTVNTVKAKDKVIKVGNKQVTHEGDKTITTTYDVDPNTGALTNPQTHASMSWSELIPAKPVAPNTDHHESDNSGDNTGTNSGTNTDTNAAADASNDTSASQPKHLKQTPKTGDAGNIAELFSFLGASVLSLSFMHQRTKMTKRK